MTTAEIATAFAKRGWYVLPISPNQKTPFFPIADAEIIYGKPMAAAAKAEDFLKK